MTRLFPGSARTLGAAMLAVAAFTSSVAIAQIDAAKSSVTAVARQIGVPMEGKFKRFDATVNFDAGQPEKSSARVEIDMNSFEIGDAVTTKELRGKDWFDTAKYPKATFVSSQIKSTGANRYDVVGKLTLKGKTVDLVVPATHRAEGATQVFEGALPIKRNAFNIGDGEWKDTSVVSSYRDRS
jgi:polyisoprenoid-binding protein YceI